MRGIERPTGSRNGTKRGSLSGGSPNGGGLSCTEGGRGEGSGDGTMGGSGVATIKVIQNGGKKHSNVGPYIRALVTRSLKMKADGLALVIIDYGPRAAMVRAREVIEIRESCQLNFAC